MRRVSAPFAVVALTGFYLTAGAFAEFSVAASALGVQKKPIPQKKPLPQKNPIPMSEASVKAGLLVYAKNCRPCHGLQGKGDGVAVPPGAKPANLVDEKWEHGASDAQIFKTIKEGVGPDYFMQVWDGKITNTEIWNTINFLRDLAKRAKK